MEPDDDDEYQYDSRTAVGQLLKRVEKLMKKPTLDEQLSELLDKFRCYFLEQQEYLNNGIFQIQFSETALFVQACSKLFVKKVDVYWDQVLGLHTRLIEYDVEHARKTGTQVDRAVIDRLEERRNRNKRKKKYKIIESDEWLTEIYNHKHNQNELTEPCEVDQDCVKVWDELYRASEKYRRYHPLVREQQLKVIKFDRKVAERDDFDVYNVDGEFIMKASKMPGWRDLYDLIEYNNEGLLPDKDNVISGLKLKYFGRIEYLRENCIPFDTPYEEYRDGWEKYKLRFLELESRKWQNRPLNTLEDLSRQYEYIAEMANGDEPEIVLPCNSIPLPKIMEPEIIQNNHVVNSNNLPNLDLFVVLDRLPADVVNMKSRQDSGFYEDISEDDCNDESNEFSALNIPNGDSSSDLTINHVNKENQQNVNSDCGIYLSDHNYCAIPENITPLGENKENKEMTNNSMNTNAVVTLQNLEQIIPRARETLKRKLMVATKEPALPKVRKLSKREVEKLSRSFIKPVKELKFEKFFSMNYHPQVGEGEIQPVNYESDEEYDEVPEPFDTEENKSRDAPESSGSPEVVLVSQDASESSGSPEVVPISQDTSESSGSPEVVSISQDASESSGSPEVVPIIPESPTIVQSPQNLSEVVDTCESILNEAAIKATSQPDNLTQKEIEIQELRKYLADSRKEAGVDESRDALLEEREAAIARVQAWKEHIKPIIKGLKETDFDIHEYGSRIMDGMQINQEKPFKDIVKGKSSAEVVRLFISSLQLASTSNIEICGVTPGELANNTYKVKLLKTERYHEDLEGYQAPSREVVKERKKRMKEKKQSQKPDLSDDEPLIKIMKKPKQYTSIPCHSEPSTSHSSRFHVPETRRRSSGSGVISLSFSPSSHYDTEDEGFNESFSSAAGTSFSSSFSEMLSCHSTPKAKTKRVSVDLRQDPNMLNFSL